MIGGGSASLTYLEHVEALILDHLTIIAQQFHADLQVLSTLHVGHHHVVIGPVQEDLAQQLDTLPLGDIGVRQH